MKVTFYACMPAPDRKRQIEILVTRDGAKKEQTETGVVYPDFKTAWNAMGKKNAKAAGIGEHNNGKGQQ